MPSIPEKLQELLQPITEKINVYVVEVILRGERTSKVIEVYVDSDEGITLEQCSVVSRELSEKLDEADLIQGRYRLDVSSPGLDRPLRLHRQYGKNIGRMCKVKYNEEGKKNIREGVLERVTDTSITIIKDKKSYDIPFSSIVETFVVPQL